MLVLPHLLIAAGLGLTAGAPRKSHHSSHQGPNCITVYIIVWETEYQEVDTYQCVTTWLPECGYVSEEECRPTTREVVSYEDMD